MNRFAKGGIMDKPVRVLLVKNGKAYGGTSTFPSPSGLPRVGDSWDERHVVIGGRRGKDGDEYYEVILTLEESQETTRASFGRFASNEYCAGKNEA